MFGRGALDMKSGVAGQMCLVRYFAEHPEELDGNLIAIAECDEEDNSHGIISALRALKQWKAQHDLEFIAAINADYSTPYHELDENRYVYFGTIGKLLPILRGGQRNPRGPGLWRAEPQSAGRGANPAD